VLLGDTDPQVLLSGFMDGLMSALEVRKAAAPKVYDRSSRVVMSMIGGEKMRKRESVREGSKSKGKNKARRRKKRRTDGSEDSESETSADSGSESSQHSDTSAGSPPQDIPAPRPRNRKPLKVQPLKVESDEDLPMPLPLGLSSRTPSPAYHKIDPRVGFLKGGRIRRRKGRDVLQRALIRGPRTNTEEKWRIALLTTLTALRPPGLFIVAMHLHFELTNHFFEEKPLPAHKTGWVDRTFIASDIISKVSVLFAVRNFLCSESLQRLFVEECSCLIQGRPSDKHIIGLITALQENFLLPHFADTEVGLTFVLCCALLFVLFYCMTSSLYYIRAGREDCCRASTK
jgi:hypothetical protein